MKVVGQRRPRPSTTTTALCVGAIKDRPGSTRQRPDSDELDTKERDREIISEGRR